MAKRRTSHKSPASSEAATEEAPEKAPEYPALVWLSEMIVQAAKEGDIETVMSLRGARRKFRPRGRKNAFGEVGLKIDLGIPCTECGFSHFYNNDAGAECLVCGKMHVAK